MLIVGGLAVPTETTLARLEGTELSRSDLALKKALSRFQALTVSNRWRLEPEEPYLVSFDEVEELGCYYPEDDFRVTESLPGEPPRNQSTSAAHRRLVHDPDARWYGTSWGDEGGHDGGWG